MFRDQRLTVWLFTALITLPAPLLAQPLFGQPLLDQQDRLASLHQSCREQFPLGPQGSLREVVSEASRLSEAELKKLPYSAKSNLGDFIFRQDFPLDGWQGLAESDTYVSLMDDIPAIAMGLNDDLDGALNAIKDQGDERDRSVAVIRLLVALKKRGPEALLDALPYAIAVADLANLEVNNTNDPANSAVSLIYQGFAAAGALQQAEQGFTRLEDSVQRNYALAVIHGLRGDLDGFLGQFQSIQPSGFREREVTWELFQTSLALQNNIPTLIEARHRIDALTKNDSGFSATWLDYSALIVAHGLEPALALARAHNFQGLAKESAEILMKELAKFGRAKDLNDASIALFMATLSQNNPFARHAHFMDNPHDSAKQAFKVLLQQALKLQMFDTALRLLPASKTTRSFVAAPNLHEWDLWYALAALDTQTQRHAAKQTIEAWSETQEAASYLEANSPDSRRTEFLAFAYIALKADAELASLMEAAPELQDKLPTDISQVHLRLREQGLMAQYRFNELWQIKSKTIADSDRPAFDVTHKAISLGIALEDCFPLGATKYGL